MRIAVARVILAAALVCTDADASPPVTSAATGGDLNLGARLVASNGCAGCHGAALQGTGVGPKLYGIEHRRTVAQLTHAIDTPTAPMPKNNFSAAQTASIVAYLVSLDGASGAAPVATLTPQNSLLESTLTVRFPGVPPKAVTAKFSMQMGAISMGGAKVVLKPTSDAHVWRGVVRFSMSGAWTIEVHYDGKTLTVPANVSGAG